MTIREGGCSILKKGAAEPRGGKLTWGQAGEGPKVQKCKSAYVLCKGAKGGYIRFGWQVAAPGGRWRARECREGRCWQAGMLRSRVGRRLLSPPFETAGGESAGLS